MTLASRVRSSQLLVGMLWSVATGLGVSACSDDLGECDEAAAQELVYGRAGLVATKGQALMHDSCGNAAFCHSSSAKSDARHGAPSSMNFDMLPAPTGWPRVVDDRSAVWDSVRDGDMPPTGVGSLTRGDGDWVFDAQRRPGARKLPALASEAGKAAMRNWLACGSPIVAQTRIPAWAAPAGADAGVELADWSEIFTQIVQPSCSVAGCHNATAAGGLKMLDECGAYRQLMAAGSCGGPRLVPNDGDSMLLNKLEAEMPECGLRMPPAPYAPLPPGVLAAIRAWVEAGAPAEHCQ